jgi:PAS domain-containing protein
MHSLNSLFDFVILYIYIYIDWQIQESKERLEFILASIQDAFIALDDQQRFTYVNANAAIMLGANKEGTQY